MSKPLQIFIGWDHRQPISYTVLQHSIIMRASEPVSIAPLRLPTLPTERVGLTPFTFSRYLVPWLMDYDGWALFLDADILVLDDVADLFEMADSQYAVMVSKNPRQFEWASVMLWNCGHPANRIITPQWLNATDTPEDSQQEASGKFVNDPFKFGWLTEGQNSALIGELPREWNHLVGYDEPREGTGHEAKLVHYTMGVPCFNETSMCEYAQAWKGNHTNANGAVPWSQLMGNSVHATHLPDGRVLPHFHPDVINATKTPQKV